MYQYSLNTPAKINLFLKVNGKNSNNYHEIETIFLPLENIYDTIAVSFNHSSDVVIKTNHPDVPIDESNLCYKAGKLYFSGDNIAKGMTISIEKRIPIAGGMGGGSSDAAAVLLILQKEFNLFNDEELLNIAAKLGADVPFFLNSVISVGRGAGEILNPFNIKQNFYIIICAPHFPVSAGWAYKNLKRSDNNLEIDDYIDSLSKQDLKLVTDTLRNDLAAALYEKFPILTILKNGLIEAGALNAEITGSGPTLFAICENKKQAEYIVNKMKKKFNANIEYLITNCLEN